MSLFNVSQINMIPVSYTHLDVYKRQRLGWYRRSAMNVVNFTISSKVLGIKKRDKLGLVNPLDYYLKSL